MPPARFVTDWPARMSGPLSSWRLVSAVGAHRSCTTPCSLTLAPRSTVRRSLAARLPNAGPRHGMASRRSQRSFSSSNTIASMSFRSSLGAVVTRVSDGLAGLTPGEMIVGFGERVLVTGSTGFLGSRVVASLLHHGFRNICCFARRSSDLGRLEAIVSRRDTAPVDVMRGNLLSREDCEEATKGVAVIYHL